jgi:hypothetical protein
MGWVVNATPRPLFPQEEITYPFYRRLGVGRVWTGAENVASTSFRTPDRPARNKSLPKYRYRHKLTQRQILQNCGIYIYSQENLKFH